MANRRSICPQSDYSVVHLFADTAIGKKGAVVFYPMYLSRVCSRQQTSEEIANLIVISHITMMTRCFFFNLLCNNKGSAAVSVTHKHVASAWQEFSGEISHTIRSVALMASAPGRPMICKLLPSMSSRRWAHTLEFYTGILPIYITSCLLPTITSFAQNAQNAQVCAKSIDRFYNLHNILIICVL